MPGRVIVSEYEETKSNVEVYYRDIKADHPVNIITDS